MSTKTIKLLLLCMAVACSCKEQKGSIEIAPVRVKTITMDFSPIDIGQSYSGTVEEMSGTTLSFPAGGTIKTMNVNEGQIIGKGQLIATVDATTMSNGVTAAQATTSQASDMVQQTRDTYHQAKDAYDRMKILHDNGSLPEIKWIEAETRLHQAETAMKTAQSSVRSAKASEQIARKGLADTRLVAPFSGYVSKKMAEIGQNMMPDSPVVKIVLIDRVKVKISVPEREIAHFEKGQSIAVKVEALNGRIYEATVIEKGISADPLSRSYDVKAVVNNPGHQLLPGMVCEVYANPSQGKTALMLPADIILIDADNRTFVWVADNGRATKKYVETKENIGNNIVISEGLASNDKIIIEGQQKVSQGMKVIDN